MRYHSDKKAGEGLLIEERRNPDGKDTGQYGNTLAPWVWQTAIGDGFHFPLDGSSTCLPTKKLMH